MNRSSLKLEFIQGLRNATPYLHAFLNFIYPPSCILCRSKLPTAVSGVCHECLEDIPRSNAVATQSRTRTSNIDKIVTVWEFCENIQTIVHEYKYGKLKSLASPLGDAMAEVIAEHSEYLQADLLVPVPLHQARLRERGFNQSRLIAERIGTRLGFSVETASLRRARQTKSQSQLNAEQRQENVAGAFKLKQRNPFKGKIVILVDDVFTTGATLDACAACVREAKPKTVLAVTAVNAI